MELTKDNSYTVQIEEFNDDFRIHPKKLTVKLKNNEKINASIIVNIAAPAIRSTETNEEFQHKFFKTSDGKFLSLKEE